MKMTLKLTNQRCVLKTIRLDISPGEAPVVKNSFYTKLCGQDLLLAVVAQSNNNWVSWGVFYTNVVINPENGSLIKEFGAGEFQDKETGEMI